MAHGRRRRERTPVARECGTSPGRSLIAIIIRVETQEARVGPGLVPSGKGIAFVDKWSRGVLTARWEGEGEDEGTRRGSSGFSCWCEFIM